MNVQSHYETLSVSRNAPPEVIRAAYKALSQKWHPDKNASTDAANAMKALNAAYDQLSDPARRRAYDNFLDAEEMRWAFAHPQVHPQPSPEPERMAPKARRSFQIDERLFTEAMKKARHPIQPKRNLVGLYARASLLYGGLGIAVLLAKLTFAG